MESKTRRSPAASRATQADEDLVDVLLVEDDPSVLEMYRLKLELDGYRVNTALDGEEGLKKAGDLKPDIIFLDIRLPKMDGLEVLRKLRAQEKTREIPVIILSNYDEEDLVARAAAGGARVPHQGAHHADQSLRGHRGLAKGVTRRAPSDTSLSLDKPIYTISVASEILQTHPRTLMMYEHLGLVVPKRTSTNRRRFSQRDIRKLQAIQTLTRQHGVNLNGARYVLRLLRILVDNGLAAPPELRDLDVKELDV